MKASKKVNLPVSGNLELNTANLNEEFVLIGGASLTTDVVVSLGTPSIPFKQIKLTYVGLGTVLNGNTLEILGVDISEFSNATMSFNALYSGGEWIVQVSSDFNTVNIPDNSIIPNKLASSANLYTIALELNSEISNPPERKIRIPHGFSLHSFSYHILKEFTTEGWNIEMLVNGQSSHILELPQSVGLGTSSVVTSLTNVRTSENPAFLSLKGAKTTEGGAILLSLVIERI